MLIFFCYNGIASSLCARPLEYGVHDVLISIKGFMRVRISYFQENIESMTFCVLIAQWVFKVCVLVHSFGLIFGQLCIWPECGPGFHVVFVRPMLPDCTVEC